MFKNGHMSLMDAERSRLPATALTKRNEERTLELVLENRRITVEEVAGRLNVSVGSAYSLIHDSLIFSKVCARWVPKVLTEEHKRKCLDVCSRPLARYHEERDNFLQQSLGMKHGFTITSLKASGRVCNGSIHHLL